MKKNTSKLGKLAVMWSKKATGFVGWVTYAVKDKESEWDRVTYMLAKYAVPNNRRKQNRRIQSLF